MGQRARRQLLMLRSDVVQGMRQRLWALGFVEVETPILHPSPAVQRLDRSSRITTRSTPILSQGGARVVPEATRRRRLRQSLRDRPQLSQRGRLAPAQPRVHDTRALPGLRRLQDTMVVFEELVAGVARTPRHHRACPTAGGSSTSRRHGGGHHVRAGGRGHRVHAQRAQPAPRTGPGGDRGRDRGGASWGPGKILLEIYEKTTEAELWGPVFVIDYPAEVSPLARRHRDGPDLVERYEPWWPGRELGNGFTELIDPDDHGRVHGAGGPTCGRRR